VSRFDLTTIGEGQLRYSVPAGTRLELAENFQISVAGTEANVAGLLSRVGWHCGWFSSLPNSPLGHRVANEYSLAGIDLSAVLWREAGRVATYYVEYAEPPRSAQVYYDRANTCFTNLVSDEIDWEYLTDTRILHLSGLTLPLSQSLRQIVPEAARRARAKGAMVSFDVNYRSRIWTPEEAREALLPLIRDVDILFCGRRDAQQLFMIQGEPKAIVEQLGNLTHAKHLVVSLSDEGLIGWDRKEFFQQPAWNVKIVDRIGAGDAMVAGVIDGILAGNFAKGIRTGAVTAALALSQYGDQVITNRGEIELLLNAPHSADICR